MIKVFLAALAAVLMISSAADAHPHAWIDLKVKILFDDSGRIAGLREIWLFDEFYSSFATEGLDADGDGLPDQEALVKLAALNLKNLSEFGYFSDVQVSGEPVAFDMVTEMSSSMAGGRLEMVFDLPFSEPVAPGDRDFTYAIYDPTFYVEILHADQEGAIQLDNAPEGCRFALIKPQPDAGLADFAASLDKTQSAGNGLGISFSEKVTVTCVQ